MNANASPALNAEQRHSWRENGYLTCRLLDEAEVSRYVDAVEGWRRRQGDDSRMLNLQFLQPDKAIRGIQGVICHPAVLKVCRELLGGGGIIIDGASLFQAQAGVDYRQGWHRDVMQVPDERVDPRWFRADHDYNYVQMNLALTADACLWIVPGSHRRPLDADERAVFGDNVKMAPVDAGEIAAARCIALHPGEAAFYNNLAVHRGYGGVLEHRRITLQLGFHSDRQAPTFQFGVLDHRAYTEDYLDSLDPGVRRALRAHLAERARYPQVDEYHAWHQQFIRKEFRLK